MQEKQEMGKNDPLEEGMATHSNILAWRIPWTEEHGGLQSIELQWVGHDWNNLAHTHTCFIKPTCKGKNSGYFFSDATGKERKFTDFTWFYFLYSLKWTRWGYSLRVRRLRVNLRAWERPGKDTVACLHCGIIKAQKMNSEEPVEFG